MIAAEYLDDTDGQWKPCHEVRRWRNGATVGSNCIGNEGRFQIEAHKVRRLEPKERDHDLILYAIELWVRRCGFDVAYIDWPKTALSSVEEDPETFDCRVILRNEKGLLATYRQNARGMRIEKPLRKYEERRKTNDFLNDRNSTALHLLPLESSGYSKRRGLP